MTTFYQKNVVQTFAEASEMIIPEVEGLMRLIVAMLLTAAAALTSVHQQAVKVDVAVLHQSQSVLTQQPVGSLP